MCPRKPRVGAEVKAVSHINSVQRVELLYEGAVLRDGDALLLSDVGKDLTLAELCCEGERTQP